MDEDIVTSLLSQIDDMRNEMDTKDAEISRLKGYIEVLRRREEALEEIPQGLAKAVSATEGN